jgi:UPF0755 protein
MRQQTQASVFRPLFLIFLFLLCLGSLGTLVWFDRLQYWSMQDFGPAAPGLSATQKTLYVLRLYWVKSDLVSALDANGQPKAFTVPMGEGVVDTTRRLQEEGLIRSAEALRLYLIYSGLDTTIQAGEFKLSPAMNSLQIAHALQDATPGEVAFNILAGMRMEEVAGLLPTSGLSISQEDFLQQVREPGDGVVPPDWPKLKGVEGFLFPGSYKVKRESTAPELVNLFLIRFDSEIHADLRAGFEREGLSLLEAVTLASIVQREAVVEEEQPKIAGVFFNRLRDGMKLQSDPTVQYAAGYQSKAKSWWKNPLKYEDFEIDSPYNTYYYAGLPPAPISNPGYNALKAVAFPEKTDFVYFRARCDGSGLHNFSKTYEEHVGNECP